MSEQVAFAIAVLLLVASLLLVATEGTVAAALAVVLCAVLAGRAHAHMLEAN